MLVHRRPLSERRPSSWRLPSRPFKESMMGRESAKRSVTLVPEPEETESSSSGASSLGASSESSNNSSRNGDDDGEEEEIIDVDAALDAKREDWGVPTTLSWTPVKVVQPVTPEQRRSMGRSRKQQQQQQQQQQQGVRRTAKTNHLVVATHRLTAVPELPTSAPPMSSIAASFVQDQQQQPNEPPSYEELMRRVEALEVGAVYRATKEEVDKVEAEFLLKLRAIREAVVTTTTTTSASASTAPAATASTKSLSSTELEALRAENEVLKKRNAKLEYRVQHVVGEMGRLYDQVVELKMSAEESSMAEF